MNAQNALDLSANIALALLSLSFLLTIFRIVKGPTLPDRILGLDLLVGVVIGYIAVLAIKTHHALYVDIALALGLVGFLATVAFARFVMVRGQADEAGLSDGHVDAFEKKQKDRNDKDENENKSSNEEISS